MTDIVERLREGITLYSAALENSDIHMGLLSKAADEIERLRDQIKTVSAMNVKLVEEMDAVRAERDAAVKLLEAIRQDEQCAHWHESIDAARGEK